MTGMHSEEWCLHFYLLAVGFPPIQTISVILKYLPGDTTAYSISWLTKEILHHDNRHLDAVEKIRKEAEQVGLADSYLSYEDVPVCDTVFDHSCLNTDSSLENAIR